MADVLCVWELGSGLGHLTNLRPFVDAAQAAGHRVSLAVRELDNLGTVFPERSLPVYQAPSLWRQPMPPDVPIHSYPQLVLRRFGDTQELEALCRGWESIFAAVRPDAVVYDFAPSAMIASLGRPWRKWVTGNGFFIPRTDTPFFGLFPGVRNEPAIVETLAAAERHLLRLSNAVLEARGRALIARAAEMMTQADEILLLTLPELDQFGARPDGHYLGPPPPIPAPAPQWPDGDGPRVFAYLSVYPSLETLLAELVKRGVSLLVYARNIGADLKQRFPRVRFVETPIDLPAAYEQADLAVNMGSHSTSAQAYLAGVPQLMIPRRQEQALLALRVQLAGRGIALTPDSKAVAEKVDAALALAAQGRKPVEPEHRAALSGALVRQRLRELFDRLPSGLYGGTESR